MQTDKPIIHWADLFNQNGNPHPHFQSVIDENKIPLIEHGELQNKKSTTEKSILLWNQGTPEKVHNPTSNVRNFLDTQVQKINGSITDYAFAGVQMPTKNSAVILKKLRFYFKREQRRDVFGEWLWQQIQEKKYTIHSLANMLANVRFDLVYIKDIETGGVKQLPFPVDRHDGGIYMVQENSIKTAYKETVYVGKSLKAMRTTLWCHFHEWRGKYTRERAKGSRAEDRGHWIEKIQDGECTYSIGTIRVLPHHEGFPGIDDQQVRTLERLFIHLLDPRDNKADKPVIQDETQGSLFETLSDIHGEVPPPDNSAGNDDVPF